MTNPSPSGGTLVLVTWEGLKPHYINTRNLNEYCP